MSRKELDTVLKIVKTDPENLVKSAGMWTLAGTRNKRFLSVFEEGLTAHSSSIKGAALNGIAQIAPERAKRFLQQSRPEELTSDQLIGLASVVVRHRMTKYLGQLIGYLIYYPFAEKGDPEQAVLFRQGYEWAMSLDDTPLVEKTILPFREMKPFLDDDGETKRLILEVLNNGLQIKNRLPQTLSVKEQIRLIGETIHFIEQTPDSYP